MHNAPFSQHALSLQPHLVAQEIYLVDQTEEDISFLRDLYISVRWEELAPTDWSELQKVAFLESQFSAQYQHYNLVYVGAKFRIIRQGNEPIGRLVLFSNAHDIRVVDISFLPAWRNLGIGSSLLNSIFEEAQTTHKTVSIHVEQFNPALALYLRLGFTKREEHGPYWLMEWHPGSDGGQLNTA
jgi:ribosomal protein S18 acetylase RimI-like enzyme